MIFYFIVFYYQCFFINSKTVQFILYYWQCLPNCLLSAWEGWVCRHAEYMTHFSAPELNLTSNYSQQLCCIYWLKHVWTLNYLHKARVSCSSSVVLCNSQLSHRDLTLWWHLENKTNFTTDYKHQILFPLGFFQSTNVLFWCTGKSGSNDDWQCF